MSAMPFGLYESAATVAKRKADQYVLLRQAELFLRAASMKVDAARLDQSAQALNLLLDDEPSTLPDLDLRHAQQDVAKYASECERLRKELGL